MKKGQKTIDITPTWEAVMPLMIATLESGTEQAKEGIVKELYKLARFADAVNTANKKKNKES